MPKNTFFNLSMDKQENVIRSAISEFVKHGFEKGNIGNIAKNAGVAKGSMYQYFENKKELFIYSSHWAVQLFIEKYGKNEIPKNMDLFDYFYQSSAPLLKMLREEREIAVFIQDIFLGKYMGITDESINMMMSDGDKYVLTLIKEGKKNGSLRNDIDDNILASFMTGATMKIKENIMKEARNNGNDIVDDGFEKYDNEIKAMLELLKNGMGAKSCL